MLRSNNNINYERLNTSIQEGGGLYNLEEIIMNLKMFNEEYDTHSMNEGVLFLKGQKDMLEKIIVYLKKCL